MMVDESRINNTLGKMALYLGNHKSILCSVSGGSDSDIIVHMIATYFREFLPKIHFAFVNTGLEYQATRDHLDFLEHKYDIHIERIRGMPIPVAVRKYGVPVISKRHAQYIGGFARGNAPSYKYYVLGPAAVGKPEDAKKKSAYIFRDNQRQLAEAVKERGIKISAMCCDKSKKAPLQKYCKANGIDLSITGERELLRAVPAPRYTKTASSRIPVTAMTNTCPCGSGMMTRSSITKNLRTSGTPTVMRSGV